MKILFKSLCVGVIVSVLFTFIPFEGECREISEQVFRVHILANSDSQEDQSLKLKVRDAVLKKSEELFFDTHSKEDAMKVAADNLNIFKETAESVISAEGYDYSVRLNIKNILFDTRYYDDITMPGGYYDALQISIGDAKGKNWWCVMYPSLCIPAASDNDSLDDRLTDKQYNIVSAKGGFRFRFKVVEIFNDILDFFSFG
ncbi:MAG: stage II sporulation protein R [Ruminococcus sp.]|nr:stage II sporulation protein R [Ruminococcus sp.]